MEALYVLGGMILLAVIVFGTISLHANGFFDRKKK